MHIHASASTAETAKRKTNPFVISSAAHPISTHSAMIAEISCFRSIFS